MNPETAFSPFPTRLQGLVVLQRKIIADERGSLSRLYCHAELASLGWPGEMVQSNHSYTAARGTLRGMHYQLPPHGEDKLVTCVRGSVFDVAVDLRRNSPSFLQWHGQVLSASNGLSMLLPKGFAHGFQTLEDDCDLIYMHSTAYAARSEAGLSALDKRVAIEWPLPVARISARDAGFPAIGADFPGI